jgi:hypothetical protein
LRKFLFVITLVGASFAGGAVVNGPGLQWAKTTLLSQLGGQAEGAAEEDLAAPKVDDGSSNDPIPAKPAPLLANSGVPSAGENGKGPAKDSPSPAPTPNPVPTPPPAAAPVAGDASPTAVSAPANSPAPKAPDAPNPQIVTRDGESQRPLPAGESQIILAKGGDAPDRPSPLDPPTPLEASKDQEAPADPKPAASPWSDAPGSAPAAAVPPRSAERSDPTVDRSAAASAGDGQASRGDWAAVRRKMAALGVSRYGFEGEPRGRVRFHCLIPLAGRRAVAQQFEAEADDEWQAVEAALRRVALWRATENPEP